MRARILAGFLLWTPLAGLAGWGSPAATGFPPAERACTSFCLDNGGQAVFVANYDNEIWEGQLFVNKRGVTKTGWETGTGGKVARWTAEYGSVTFNLAGIHMAWGGMNEARVRIAGAVDHYLICDRSGACAAVEFLEGRTVFHTGEALPVKALTNTAYQTSVEAWRCRHVTHDGRTGRSAGDGDQPLVGHRPRKVRHRIRFT
jgi:penicillin V acylase-like amidase (Ntn superfamily)